MSTIRMTASLAEKLFRTATPITAAGLTEHHLDMLQLSDIGIHTRLCLGEASDALLAGDHRHPSVVRCVEAYNQRCR